MPGLAATLARKAKQLQNGMGALTKFFISLHLYCRLRSCQFSWLKKKEITGVRPPIR